MQNGQVDRVDSRSRVAMQLDIIDNSVITDLIS